MNISSVFALFIGMFIIYNSFSIAVTQRRSEIGVLRALGAPRRQIRNLFLVESAASGLVGSVAGIALGIVMARGMVGSISNMLEGIYGVAERAEEVSADPRLLGLAMAIGIVTSMLAAWLPARSASRVDPVQALQKGKYQVLTAGENRTRRLLAAASMAGAVVCLWIGTVDLVLRRVHLDRARLAAARSDGCPLVLAGAAAGPEVAPSRGRRARGRQPHPIAEAHVGRRGRADALARAGHRPWRRRPRKLQLHRRLAEHRAESGPVRRGIAEAVRSHVQISGGAGGDRSKAIDGVDDVQTVRSFRLNVGGHTRNAHRHRCGQFRAPRPSDGRPKIQAACIRWPSPARASSFRTTSPG